MLRRRDFSVNMVFLIEAKDIEAGIGKTVFDYNGCELLLPVHGYPK